MFKIQVRKELIDHCSLQVEQYNFGQRGYADGTKDQQLTGVIGQSQIAELFGEPWVTGEGGFDDGQDLLYKGLVIDVKTMGRTTDVRPYYVNNFVGLQKRYRTDVYIFCSYNKTNFELTICGWVTKKQLNDRSQFFPKGSVRKRSDGSSFKTFTDLYEICNESLNQVDSLNQLFGDLDTIKLQKYR
jgi:hypothetical protein